MTSPFLEARREYKPRGPKELYDLKSLSPQQTSEVKIAADATDRTELKSRFAHLWDLPLIEFEKGEGPAIDPMTVGVVLSGGQAPGGHNVICGIHQGLSQLSSKCRLLGFLGGPSGILDSQYMEVTQETVADFINTGGFNMLGSGRTKIESDQQFADCKKNLESLEVDYLVVIGGDDSNTNAALLAEYFLAQKSRVKVIGVPKTIDGDLQNDLVEMSFGFDTATRVYAELIANICRDAASARKYYHFIRLMGRSASHITLEAGIQTQPNYVIVSEEVEEENRTLQQIVADIADLVCERAEAGHHYGVVLVPEGLIEFIPAMKTLIADLNDHLAHHGQDLAAGSDFMKKHGDTYSALPADIRNQLLMDRDPHGNVQVSRIETEKLLIEMVETELKKRQQAGTYQGKFSHQAHFFGYEGRCAAPTNFDADYGYALGQTAVALMMTGATGYMATVTGLANSRDDWHPQGAPLVAMMNIERRKGKEVPVIRKSLVETSGAAYKYFQQHAKSWRITDQYRFAGPIQYFGPAKLTDRAPKTMALHQGIECDW